MMMNNAAGRKRFLAGRGFPHFHPPPTTPHHPVAISRVNSVAFQPGQSLGKSLPGSLSLSVCVYVCLSERARHFVARTYLCLLRTCANHHIIANDLFLFLFFFPFRRCCFFGCCPLFFATAVDISDGFATSLTPRKRTKHEKVATGDRMEAGVALPRRWEAPPPASVPLPVPLNFYHHCHRPPIHRKKRNNIQSSIQGGESEKNLFKFQIQFLSLLFDLIRLLRKAVRSRSRTTCRPIPASV